ncbi:hypothetical protein MyNCGM683_06590 [Achromobacter xylosoxidans]
MPFARAFCCGRSDTGATRIDGAGSGQFHSELRGVKGGARAEPANAFKVGRSTFYQELGPIEHAPEGPDVALKVGRSCFYSGFSGATSRVFLNPECGLKTGKSMFYGGMNCGAEDVRSAQGKEAFDVRQETPVLARGSSVVAADMDEISLVDDAPLEDDCELAGWRETTEFLDQLRKTLDCMNAYVAAKPAGGGNPKT